MKKFYLLIPLFLFAFSMTAQKTITGTVTSSDENDGMPGVSIVVKGTSVGTMTTADGTYSIEVPGESGTLVFSFIGYDTQEIEIGSNTEVNCVLVASTSDIEEVIVVGYGVQKKSLVTGAISKVDGEEIAKGGNLRVNQSIQGKTAGVVVTNNSGQPGDFVSMRIRGTGTNGNAEPLYIVDGLPLNGNGIDYLNPSDVESIEILKDAAASSIYGARGANGVVLITTKKGSKNQGFQVTYDGYFGFQNPWRKLDLLNTDEYVMIMNESALNAGQAPKFDQAMIDTLGYTDWQDEMFNYNAPKMSHVLSFTGGTEKSTYSSSLAYFGQTGIVAKDKSEFERITYRLNTTRDFGFFELGSNINLARLNTKGIAPNDHYAGTSLIQALNTPPIVPVTYSNGTYATPEDFGVAMQEITNPIAMLSYLNSKTTVNKVIGNLYGNFDFGEQIQFLKGLTFRTNFGGELSYVTNDSYNPVYELDATHSNTVDQINKSIDLWGRWNFENVLSYTKSIDVHNFTVMAGNTLYKDWHESIAGSKSDALFDDFDHAYLDNAQDPESASVGGTYSEHTLMSYFGRINYDLMNKYLLTVTFRADGSSRFGSENKFGYFPSVSAGWILTNEGFFSGISAINFLKLRASWGQNGNEDIADFRYTPLISSNSIYYFGTDQTQYNGAQPGFIPNPFLKWETSEQTDIGIDLRLLNNIISITADYYIKDTKDWLITPPMPRIAGTGAPYVNGGDVRNSGFELEVRYQQRFGDLKIDAMLTGSTNKNEVLSIPNVEERLQGGSGGHGQADILYAEPGTPMGVFYLIETDGIFQNQAEIDAYVGSGGTLIQPNAKPGDIKFVDFDGDGEITDGDRQFLGDPYPDFTGGLNIYLEWKGIDFNMFWYSALGFQVFDATRRYDLLYANYRGDVLNRWTGEGTSDEYPRVTFNDANNNFSTPSDFFLKDADYLRLKNITLGYTIPQSITEKAKISKLRIYVSGENVFTFTKYKGLEPEMGGGIFSNAIDHGIYPQARTILGGISLTF